MTWRLKSSDRLLKLVVEIDLENYAAPGPPWRKNHIEELSFHKPVKIVEEFARTIEKEMDYTLEAASMERVSGQFLGDPSVYVPQGVSGTFTTRRVLTS